MAEKTRDPRILEQAPADIIKQTPMMKQYLEQKASHPDCLLFFRLGDFYEMFFEDAQLASKILDIALTSRSKGEGAVPMCGVPYFSANGYIAKLVDAGHKVAICDQVEDPKQAKGIVKRQVTRVVSPGMITDPDSLDARESNYLAAVVSDGDNAIGFSFLDISTADFRATQVQSFPDLMNELARVRPRELLLPKEHQDSSLHRAIENRRLGNLFVKFVDSASTSSALLDALWDRIQGTRPDTEETSKFAAGLKSARLLLQVASTHLPVEGSLDHIRRLVLFGTTEHLLIDQYSRSNLELIRTQMEGSRKGSLLDVLDRTQTPMGARTLYDWLMNPLLSPERIEQRLDAVSQLVEDAVLRSDLRSCLSPVRDLERLLGRASVGQATPRDLATIRDSLAQLPSWSKLIHQGQNPPLQRIIGATDLLEDLHQELALALVDHPPLDLDEGGAIRPGYRPELDRLVELSQNGRDFIARLEQRERDRTHISSLKIRYNRVFGYYIEVTKPNLHLVPPDFRRKQTTANAERFETDELKIQEEAILNAQEQRIAQEQEIIHQLLKRVTDAAGRILQVARQIAASDVLSSLAETGSRLGYCRPQVDDSEVLEISDGRHPVVEVMLRGDRFVPNDLQVNCGSEQLLIITGPNMAGKSTAIRQVALMVIMAQMGSFVPAKSARIGVVDRIFTRIGAADNLARGQSTFMVEMIETSQILRFATRRSLLILDEIGRGTSTFDGLSIAWAVAEFIHDRIGARTLFATHYHQLADLPLTKKRVVNCTMTVKEWKDQIIFLRRLVKGVSNRSYGIQVAKLAGLPTEVVDRSKEILANLEGEEYDEVGKPRWSRSSEALAPDKGQLQLFSGHVRSAVEIELDGVDLNSFSPLEALNFLHRLKNKR